MATLHIYAVPYTGLKMLILYLNFEVTDRFKETHEMHWELLKSAPPENHHRLFLIRNFTKIPNIVAAVRHKRVKYN